MHRSATTTTREGEVEQLESQLRIMSQAAAEAIERATRLESELEKTRNRSSSASTTSSDSSVISSDLHTPEERLRVLENALNVIHRSRNELSSAYNYAYI